MKKIGTCIRSRHKLDDITYNFEQMKKEGFDCADCQYFINTKTNPLFNDMNEEEYIAHLQKEKAKADAAGIEIYQVHGPWQWPPLEATHEQRAIRMKQMQRSILGASVLGAKVVVIHPIMPFGTGKEPDHDQFWQLNIAFFRELAETAEKYNIIIGLENMPFPALSSSSVLATMQLIKDIKSPWVKLCLDTGHCIILKEEPGELIPLVKDSLVAFHIHDNNGSQDSHLLPGKGIIRWDIFRKELALLPDFLPISFESDEVLTAKEMFDCIK